MAKQKKRSDDVNVIASQIVSEATEEEPTTKPIKEKNPAAVAHGSRSVRSFMGYKRYRNVPPKGSKFPLDK